MRINNSQLEFIFSIELRTINIDDLNAQKYVLADC